MPPRPRSAAVVGAVPCSGGARGHCSRWQPATAGPKLIMAIFFLPDCLPRVPFEMDKLAPPPPPPPPPPPGALPSAYGAPPPAPQPYGVPPQPVYGGQSQVGAYNNTAVTFRCAGCGGTGCVLINGVQQICTGCGGSGVVQGQNGNPQTLHGQLEPWTVTA